VPKNLPHRQKFSSGDNDTQRKADGKRVDPILSTDAKVNYVVMY